MDVVYHVQYFKATSTQLKNPKHLAEINNLSQMFQVFFPFLPAPTPVNLPS